VGLILVFLAESLSTRPRSDDEFEALLGMPLLARLTLADHEEEARQRDDRAGRHSDDIHRLRTSLELANADVGARKIMISSSSRGEEKSVVVADLATALARVGRRVALVDLDLRTRALSRLLGLGDRPGITTLARGDGELRDVVVPVALEDPSRRITPAGSNGRGELPQLDAVSAGPPVANPADVVSSTRAAEILAELESRADAVLVDVPPVLDAPDAAALASSVDGLVLVVSSREARGPKLAEIRRATEAWPVARLGFVLTDGRGGRGHLPGFRRAGRWTSSPAAEPERVG
jgi:Mrp family chromosome partitioning ATPase